MPVESTESGIVVTGKAINLARWITIKHAIRLEIIGLRHSRGSVSAMAARHLGLPPRTRKATVLAAVVAKIEQLEQEGEHLR